MLDFVPTSVLSSSAEDGQPELIVEGEDPLTRTALQLNDDGVIELDGVDLDMDITLPPSARPLPPIATTFGPSQSQFHRAKQEIEPLPTRRRSKRIHQRKQAEILSAAVQPSFQQAQNHSVSSLWSRCSRARRHIPIFLHAQNFHDHSKSNHKPRWRGQQQ